MKCFRSVLVGLVVVACFCLTGFKEHITGHGSPTKKQHSTVKAKQQTPLDLTVPIRNVSFEETSEPLAIANGTTLDGISGIKTGNSKVVELQGHVIMSQEPEAGKIKSADGAGILINLRH